ncbi:hypothetical protein GN244_ATG11270 [Phytophthora infestans]|uniref:Uncharacterized protein n=1 Tax=Phytophthora infestans TaxID=4787 RepID=A0A833WBY0_PHYIN|nr:hypothetical protein GN244_ATG11270 [Phytophthora infestans]
MFIPKHFLKEVDNFKLLRQELLKVQYTRTKDSGVLKKEDAFPMLLTVGTTHGPRIPAFQRKEFFFIATDGRPERYLTRILKEHVHDKFSKHVIMRNGRSIYITYERHHGKSVKEMYELSRLMYHSFG